MAVADGRSGAGWARRPAGYATTGAGYVEARTRYRGTLDRVYIHQLLAIAEGADPHDVFGGGTHVHHHSGVEWDNRPDNVSLLTPAEHKAAHRAAAADGGGEP